VRLFFEQPPTDTIFAAHENTDQGQGRLEIRRCELRGLAKIRFTFKRKYMARWLYGKQPLRFGAESA
jgi:hypothetical protein